MDYKHQNPNWFNIDPSQLENAKIYLDRKSFIQQLPKSLDIMEVGVAAGDFAEIMLEECDPKILYLVDYYNQPDFYKKLNPERYTPKTNLEFVQNRFKDYLYVEILVGDSRDILPNINKYFDFIYIDADHTFEGANTDLYNSVKLLKPNGIIGFNDYIKFSPYGDEYGIIEAVHTFLKNHLDWEVIGLALQDEGMFDIYIRHKN